MKKYRLAWCSDLHFDFVRPDHRKRFLDSLVLTGADGVLITGDLSISRRIAEGLGAIAGMGLPTYFVLGNHDYYTSSFAETDAVVDSVCREHPTLVRLGHGEVISLGEDTVLIGHSGWGDGRAGIGSRTTARMNDSVLIADLRLEDRSYLKSWAS
jgi:predicted phosphohydrolase